MASFGLRVLCQKCSCHQLNRIKGSKHLSSITYSQRLVQKKKQNQNQGVSPWNSPLVIKTPEYDWSFLCDTNNLSQIKDNIEKRKGVGDIEKLQATWKQLQDETSDSRKQELTNDLNKLAADIPNTSSHLSPVGDESEANLLETHGEKKEFSFKPKSCIQVGSNLGVLRTEYVSLTTGTSTYYFIGDLAQLEQALVQYTLQHLISKGFSVVSVPDIIHPAVIEGCGFKTTGEKTQVYKLNDQDLCLAGTGEMPLAGYFINETLNYNELPKKICTVSRCFRAETSNIEIERGIYRVHQFTKVEMFGVTSASPEESRKLMEEFMSIQKELFIGLGLHFRVLEMPTQELGAPAHRKIDMEAWMPSKEFWGEISSTSDCTDFQSRHLSIMYSDEQDNILHTFSVNGTACAVPRLIMNILETNQTADGDVLIPTVLQPYMDGKEKLTKIDKKIKFIPANKLHRMIQK
ncbi:serine--tRNA ligase, mitochondrial-like [Mytilus trossulus]|uniref:serine--tRNA ligase, mitochondrial-like n=1 Tax=Mytilus trossulus TaxID=6551 RepID=UPI0030075D4D